MANYRVGNIILNLKFFFFAGFISTFVLLWSCGKKTSEGFTPPENYKEEVTVTAQEYYNLQKEKNFKKSLEYIHPLVFTQMTEEEAELLYDESESNQAISSSVESFEIQSISDCIVEGNSAYARMNYKSTTLLQVVADLPEQQFSLMKNRIFTRLKNENVEFIPDTKSFRYTIYGSMLTILDKGEEHWKFVEMSSENKDLYTDHLPAGLLQKLGF